MGLTMLRSTAAGAGPLITTDTGTPITTDTGIPTAWPLTTVMGTGDCLAPVDCLVLMTPIRERVTDYLLAWIDTKQLKRVRRSRGLTAPAPPKPNSPDCRERLSEKPRL